MGRPTLRRRLYAVLVQWFLLLVIAAGAILAFSFSGVRQSAVDDRLLLARTIARSLDGTLSSAVRDLARLRSELPALGPEAAGRLHTFRLQSPFHAATYLLDGHGRLLAADPADALPVSPASLAQHEAITAVVRKPGSEDRPVVAVVQPFRADDGQYYLVSEMSLAGSALAAFLRQLAPDRTMQVLIADEQGVVIASAHPEPLPATLPHGAVLAERIRAHRPWVSDDARARPVTGASGAPALAVMVPLEFAPWGVVVEQPRATAFAGLATMQRGFVLAGLALAAMGLLLARALSRSVVAPIQALSAQAEAIRAGDLSRPIEATGDREIAVLAETLDGARVRLASTLGELRTLTEHLESEVAARTAVIEARYRDLRLLHAVAQLAAQERDPDRLLPEILRLIAKHYGFPAAAVVTRPPDGPPATYVEPPDTRLAWLDAGEPPPPGWRRREIVHHAHLQAELYHPAEPEVGAEVMGALDHELAVSLHGAYLWKRTVEQDQQRQMLVRRLLHATEEERRRLARELHDEISQLLTVIQLSLERLDVDAPELGRARGLLTRTQKEIHRIIYDLRPSLLDDLGLAAAVKAYADDNLVHHGLEVSLEIDEELSAGPEIEITVFRIYQELVTNVLRHAEAEHVSVELYRKDGLLVLAVEDDGKGFDPSRRSGGAGITGMRERAALVGGSIRFDSEPGMGAHVVLEIPLT